MLAHADWLAEIGLSWMKLAGVYLFSNWDWLGLADTGWGCLSPGGRNAGHIMVAAGLAGAWLIDQSGLAGVVARFQGEEGQHGESCWGWLGCPFGLLVGGLALAGCRWLYSEKLRLRHGGKRP